MIQVFGDESSGNCLKVKWILDHLGRHYQWTTVPFLDGGTRTPAFLAMNPAAQVPVVVLDDGRPLAQSNAIVLHFAEGTALLPTDRYEYAKVLEWLFWEQYSHEPYVAVRRFQRAYLGRADDEIEPRLMEKGTAALGRMENHLREHLWLVGNQFSAADLCLLPYTLLAPSGGFPLIDYPGISAWIDRSCAALGLDAAKVEEMARPKRPAAT